MQVDAVNQAVGTSSLAVSGLDGGGLGKEEFLQLLVAQLQNQDPLNPMENTEFVAQLSQFSSLEQLWNVNETLRQNGDLTKSVHNALMTNLIGRDIKVPGQLLQVPAPTEKTVVYDLLQSGEVSIQVLDAQGQVVRDLYIGLQEAGEHAVVWDGRDGGGEPVSPGSYFVNVFATDSQGSQDLLATYVVGKITGLRYVDGSPVLYMGDQEVNPSDIVAVYEASDSH